MILLNLPVISSLEGVLSGTWIGADLSIWALGCRPLSWKLRWRESFFPSTLPLLFFTESNLAHNWSNPRIFIYLVFRYSSQSVHGSNMPTSLTLVRQSIHDDLQGRLVFPCGCWQTHHGRHIWYKGCDIHLGEIHRCVLTRAGEHNTGQHVDKLITCLQALRKLVIHVTFSNREAHFRGFLSPRTVFRYLYIRHHLTDRKWRWIS